MVHITAALATSCFQNSKGEEQGVLCCRNFCSEHLFMLVISSMVFFKDELITVRAVQGFYN